MSSSKKNNVYLKVSQLATDSEESEEELILSADRNSLHRNIPGALIIVDSTTSGLPLDMTPAASIYHNYCEITVSHAILFSRIQKFPSLVNFCRTAF